MAKPFVYLVNAGNDAGMSGIANDSCFPALGVLALGTWLKQRIPEINVVCRDGQVASQERLINEIYFGLGEAPLLTGVSVLSTSYQNALELAYTAATACSPVVFGNDHAAQMAPTIMREHPYIHTVVGSEYGEEALEMLVRKELGEAIDPYDIPHLSLFHGWLGYKGETPFVYDERLQDISITRSRLNPSGKRRTALDVFPIVDRTLYPEDHWETYLRNYKAKFGHLHDEEITGVTTMNRARGCSRQGSLVCKHCDMGLDIAFSSPQRFWDEVRAAHKQVRANVFYEVCDSFSSFGSFVRGVAEAKPGDLGFNPHFFVYAQALDLVRRPQMIDYFRRIGVFRVNLGLESGSDATLKHMKGRFDSVANNYAALRMLKDAGISVYGSFVLGTEAETPETLDETVRWVKRIISEGLIGDVEAQPILPLPHNYYGSVLMREGMLDPNGDWPQNIDAVSRVYVDNFSGVSYADVIGAANEIREAAGKEGLNFGSGVSRAENYAS